MMRQRCMRVALLLALALRIFSPAVASALPFCADNLNISLEPGYAIYSGTWLENETETAFLLLGSKEDNAMKLAIANRTADGEYVLTACTKRIISYDEYSMGSVYLKDNWNERRPYFTYQMNPDKEIYMNIQEVDANQWKVTYGAIVYHLEKKRCFYIEDTPNELIVYDFAFPQICWPTNVNMFLDGFDIVEVEEITIEAIRYLNDFSRTHSFGDQDERYKIIW